MTEPAAGSIYDLGYRRYEGARAGRRRAIWALYADSLRGAFGLGRGTAAKIAPAILIGLALIPAVVQLAIGVLVPADVELITHDDYYNLVKFLLGLYCAVIAPDMVGRDQRNRSLVLYFARAISRLDYAVGKYAAMWTAMLVITLVPQLLLFVGNALSTDDFGGYLGQSWDQLLPIVATAALGAALIASIGLAIAAQTPRRAFATVGIIVTFVFTLALAGVMVGELTTEVTRLAIFASPFNLVEGFSAWMFRVPPSDPDSLLLAAGYPLAPYAAVAVAVTLLGVGLLIRRYQRVEA
ncbi:MAG: ABC transporter permease subunit [Chloroflexi bacterium]|nr:ABC transporter permease subunit [Chloroflexota bacterium]MDA1002116.1 ABC transporter permease subunit [Chloroflexota bacterium]